MSDFDSERPFVDYAAFDEFVAQDRTTGRRYGERVKAIELANIQYKFRYQKLKVEKNMKPPPSTGRIFSGYLVVRKLGTPAQYETWMPGHVFHELYQKA